MEPDGYNEKRRMETRVRAEDSCKEKMWPGRRTKSSDVTINCPQRVQEQHPREASRSDMTARWTTDLALAPAALQNDADLQACEATPRLAGPCSLPPDRALSRAAGGELAVRATAV